MNPLPWLKIYPAIEDHPKSGRLAKALGDHEMAWAHVVKLWFWASRNQPDGDLSTRTDAAIGVAAGWYDKPAKFAAALRTVGFLDADGQLHDWKDEQGAHAEKFRKDRERAAAVRAEKKKTDSAPADPKPQDESRDSRATIDGASRDTLLREEGREIESEMERGEDLRSKKDLSPPKEPGGILVTPPADGKQGGLFGGSAAKGMEQNEKRRRETKPKAEPKFPDWHGICSRVHEHGKQVLLAPNLKFNSHTADLISDAMTALGSERAILDVLTKCGANTWIRQNRPFTWMLGPEGIDFATRGTDDRSKGTNYLDPLAHYPSGGDEYHPPAPEDFDP